MFLKVRIAKRKKKYSAPFKNKNKKATVSKIKISVNEILFAKKNYNCDTKRSKFIQMQFLKIKQLIKSPIKKFKDKNFRI